VPVLGARFDAWSQPGNRQRQIFEGVRRCAPLRPLFGLRMADRRLPDKEKAASVPDAALAKHGA
jgi:hypothetical protein